MQRKPLIGLLSAITCAIIALLLAPSTQAQGKADPSGTWMWTVPGRNGGPDRTNKLVLKVEGEKLTGTVTSPGRNGQTSDTAISDGTIKGDAVAFTVTREFNGNTMTIKYSGKVSEDTIKGKMEMTRNGGEPTSHDWVAKRETK